MPQSRTPDPVGPSSPLTDECTRQSSAAVRLVTALHGAVAFKVGDVQVTARVEDARPVGHVQPAARRRTRYSPRRTGVTSLTVLLPLLATYRLPLASNARPAGPFSPAADERSSPRRRASPRSPCCCLRWKRTDCRSRQTLGPGESSTRMRTYRSRRPRRWSLYRHWPSGRCPRPRCHAADGRPVHVAVDRQRARAAGRY